MEPALEDELTKVLEYSMSNALRRTDSGSAPGSSFDEVVLPHLDAAYRLARWLLRNDHDAEDAVQEAALKAFRYFRTFSGGNGRAWFFKIVRNTCYGRGGSRPVTPTDQFDEELHSSLRPTSDPETLFIHSADIALIERTMCSLPEHYREVLVLREVENLSYRELADVMDIPVGTVMSRLSRARQALHDALHDELTQVVTPERAGSRHIRQGSSATQDRLKPVGCLE
jgi:RNA polymerase sigma-70 factor (ECF subfamily)